MEKEKYTLAQRRKLRGFSQEELAVKAGLTSRTIINYESDVKNLWNASYKTIRKLVDVLDIKLNQIFLGDTSEKQKQEKSERRQTPKNIKN